jgi:hypothetical protein
MRAVSPGSAWGDRRRDGRSGCAEGGGDPLVARPGREPLVRRGVVDGGHQGQVGAEQAGDLRDEPLGDLAPERVRRISKDFDELLRIAAADKSFLLVFTSYHHVT